MHTLCAELTGFTTEIARLMGGDCTASVIKNRVADKFIAVGKLQYLVLEAGQDPAQIDINVDRKNFKSIYESRFFRREHIATKFRSQVFTLTDCHRDCQMHGHRRY